MSYQPAGPESGLPRCDDREEPNDCLCRPIGGHMPDIIGIAMALHGDNTGISESFNDDDRGYALATIQCRLHHWQTVRECEVDRTVKALLMAVVVECIEVDRERAEAERRAAVAAVPAVNVADIEAILAEHNGIYAIRAALRRLIGAAP